jgi:hypothetical protein
MIKNDEFHGILKTFKSKFVVLKKFQCILFLNLMVVYFLIFILILLWNIFWIHIYHFIWMTKVVSSFQMSIMVHFYSNDSNDTKF